jgi:molybdopterin molybdotransferase
MDGFALRSEDLAAHSSFRIVGEAAAGHPFDGTLSAGSAVRIFTGGRIPHGADRVIEQERCLTTSDRVHLRFGPVEKDNIRRRGEDVRAGSLLLPPGHRLAGRTSCSSARLGCGI